MGIYNTHSITTQPDRLLCVHQVKGTELEDLWVSLEELTGWARALITLKAAVYCMCLYSPRTDHFSKVSFFVHTEVKSKVYLYNLYKTFAHQQHVAASSELATCSVAAVEL